VIRWLLNTLGLFCLLATLALVGNELWQAVSGAGYRIVSLGELWASLHANSLVGLQTRVEAVSPWLWRVILLPILLGPAWAVALGLAVFFRLLAAFAPRRAAQPRRKHRAPIRRRYAPAPAQPEAAAETTALIQPPAEDVALRESAAPIEPSRGMSQAQEQPSRAPSRTRPPTVVRRP
jgi:hypothetical protein